MHASVPSCYKLLPLPNPSRHRLPVLVHPSLTSHNFHHCNSHHHSVTGDSCIFPSLQDSKVELFHDVSVTQHPVSRGEVTKTALTDRLIRPKMDLFSLDTSLALEYLPIVELKEDFSDFSKWQITLRFHLRYYDLLGFIGPNGQSPAQEGLNDAVLVRRRLFVYALIWKSAQAVIYSKEPFNCTIRDRLARAPEHDPKALWEIILSHGFMCGTKRCCRATLATSSRNM